MRAQYALLSAAGGGEGHPKCHANSLTLRRLRAEANGLVERVRVEAVHSSAVRLADDDRADVLVAEIFDSCLLGEGALPTFRDAARRLCKEGCVTIPAAGRMVCALASGEALLGAATPAPDVAAAGWGFARCPKVCREAAERPEARLAELAGLLAAGRDGGAVLLTEPVAVLDIGFARGRIPEPGQHSQDAVLRVTRCGMAEVVIAWIELEMTREQTFSCAPEVDGPPVRTHWQQIVTAVPSAARQQLAPGDTVTLRALHNEEQVWFELLPGAGGSTGAPLPAPLSLHRCAQLSDQAHAAAVHEGFGAALATSSGPIVVLGTGPAAAAATAAADVQVQPDGYRARPMVVLERGGPKYAKLSGMFLAANQLADMVAISAAPPSCDAAEEVRALAAGMGCSTSFGAAVFEPAAPAGAAWAWASDAQAIADARALASAGCLGGSAVAAFPATVIVKASLMRCDALWRASDAGRLADVQGFDLSHFAARADWPAVEATRSVLLRDYMHWPAEMGGAQLLGNPQVLVRAGVLRAASDREQWRASFLCDANVAQFLVLWTEYEDSNGRCVLSTEPVVGGTGSWCLQGVWPLPGSPRRTLAGEVVQIDAALRPGDVGGPMELALRLVD